MQVRKWDRVFLKPEWQDEGDSGIVFITTEDSDGDRVTIQAQLGLPINPTQMITLDMIEKVQRGYNYRERRKT